MKNDRLARFAISLGFAATAALVGSGCVVRQIGGCGWGGCGASGVRVSSIAVAVSGDLFGFSPNIFNGGQYYAGGNFGGQYYQPGYYQASAPFFSSYPGNVVAPAAGYTAPVVTPQTMVGQVQPVYAPQNVAVGQPVQGYVTPNTPPGMMTVAPPQGGQMQGIVNGQWVSRCIPDAWRAPCYPVVGSTPVQIPIPGQVQGMSFGQPVYVQQPGYGVGGYGQPIYQQPRGYYRRWKKE